MCIACELVSKAEACSTLCSGSQQLISAVSARPKRCLQQATAADRHPRASMRWITAAPRHAPPHSGGWVTGAARPRRRRNDELIHYAKEEGIAVTAYSPLGSDPPEGNKTPLEDEKVAEVPSPACPALILNQ